VGVLPIAAGCRLVPPMLSHGRMPFPTGQKSILVMWTATPVHNGGGALGHVMSVSFGVVKMEQYTASKQLANDVQHSHTQM
jgi:hypothetical protein